MIEKCYENMKKWDNRDQIYYNNGEWFFVTGRFGTKMLLNKMDALELISKFQLTKSVISDGKEALWGKPYTRWLNMFDKQ